MKATLAVLCFCLLCLAGCAVGFDPEGRPVVGMGIGESDADSIRRAATGLAGFLPEPWGTIAVTGVSAAFGVLGIGSARSAARNSRKADDKQREADTAYDAQLAAEVKAARLAGANEGFDEGAARAAAVAPVAAAARVADPVPA